jgi:phosphoenolpyruvate carboxylase
MTRAEGANEERLRVGFEKIDRDLTYLMEAFADVLRSSGDGSAAQSLPWQESTGGTSAAVTDNAMVQAHSISFQLLNMVEENTANQMRRHCERMSGLAGEPGLWGHCLRQLKEAGWDPRVLAACLPHLRVEPVLTAHPTESKRVTVLEHHRSLYLSLVQRDNTMWTPSERREIDHGVAASLERLWRTGETLLEKPTVGAERAALLHYLGNVFPEALRRADAHLRAAWEETGFDPELIADPAFMPRLRFGTWVGGDRDGHPLVTPAVTRETLAELRAHAIRLQRQQLAKARAQLSLSAHLHPAPDSLNRQIEALGGMVGAEVLASIRQRNPGEPWRQVISLLLERLPTGYAETDEQAPLSGRHYRFAFQLTRDLREVRDCLCTAGAGRIAKSDIDPVIRSVETFGFHLASLDIRQNSELHETAIAQVLRAAGWKDAAYAQWDEACRLSFLDEQLNSARPLVNPATLTDTEALAAVGALREFAHHRNHY